jgi:hypothetical protein
MNDVGYAAVLEYAEVMGQLNLYKRLLEQARAVAAHLEEEAATCPDRDHHDRGRA